MKINKLALFLLTAALAAFPSCDILDLKPHDRLSETDVWNDPQLIQMYVNSCYNGLMHGYTDSNISLYCDECYSLRSDCTTLLIGAMDQENVSTFSQEVNYWSTGYAFIRKINIFFERIDSSAATEARRMEMKGEMKFLRAYIYAKLIWNSGGVPLITGVYQLDEDYRVGRDSYDACVEFITGELTEAMAMLPDKRDDTELGRASADACRALLCRVLLYAASPLNNPTNDLSKWQQAADAAEELLDGNYRLNDDYRETFLDDNPEIIFARWFTQANSVPFTLTWGRGGSDGYGAMNPTQNIVNCYEMAATGKRPYIENREGGFDPVPLSGYDPEDPYTGRDPRFYAGIIHDGMVWAGRETETWDGGADSPQATYSSSLTRYYIKKFIPEEIPPSGTTRMPESPWIFFRYGEILLNYAEVKFELGDEDTAREYLNKVRKRPGVDMPDVEDIGEGLRERIRNERRVELAFEGHRFYDVRRWMVGEFTEKFPLYMMRIIRDGENKKYSQETLLHRDFHLRHNLIPIPRVEIEKSYGCLEQNPEY